MGKAGEVGGKRKKTRKRNRTEQVLHMSELEKDVSHVQSTVQLVAKTRSCVRGKGSVSGQHLPASMSKVRFREGKRAATKAKEEEIYPDVAKGEK
jgi:hypothetical protein